MLARYGRASRSVQSSSSCLLSNLSRSSFNPSSIARSSLIPHQECRYSSTAVNTSTAEPSIASISQDPVSSNGLQGNRQKATYVKLERPPIGRRNDPDAWLECLEPIVPEHLHEGNFSGENRFSLPNLVDFLTTARSFANIDILVYLAVTQDRWDIFFWLTGTMIDHSTQSEYYHGMSQKYLQSISPPMRHSLDEYTTQSSKDSFVESRFISNLEPSSLDQMVQDKLPYLRRDAELTFTRDFLGQLWQTLGNLILVASTRSPEETQTILAYVLCVLELLHTRGLIPESVYTRDRPHGASVSQPFLLSDLYSDILVSFSEAASETPLFLDGFGWGQDGNHVIGYTRSHMGPQIWLELVVWCCIHGGWLREAANIIGEMRKLTGRQSWSLVSWRDVPEVSYMNLRRIIREERQEEEYRLITNQTNEIDNHNTSKEVWLLERTLSVEAVAAVIEGLVADITTRGSNHQSAHVFGTIDRINALKNLLEKSRASLGAISWDEIITRLASIPEVENDENPKLMEAVLNLVEGYGREASSVNTLYQSDRDNLASVYMRNSTAASLGLYHRALLSFIRARDPQGTLRMLSRLQSMTDHNKRKSMEEFFSELKSTDLYANPNNKRLDFDFTSQFTPVDFPAFFPRLPNNVIAALIDLAIDSGPIELAEFMVHSKDVDGPLIPPAVYSNQTLAPALIRFAVSRGDKELLRQLAKAQTPSLSHRTLLAYCESKIANKEFDQAIHILSVLRQYELIVWEVNDLASMISRLLPYLNDRIAGSETKKVKQILARLLRGDFGQAWGSSIWNLHALLGVLCTANPFLANFLLSFGILDADQYSVEMLPASCFNSITLGVCQAYGSLAGRHLLDTWCADERKSCEVDLSNATLPKPENRINSSSWTKVDTPVGESDSPAAVFFGTFEPDIPLVRIIVQQALREANPLKSLSGDSDQKPNDRKALKKQKLGPRDADDGKEDPFAAERDPPSKNITSTIPTPTNNSTNAPLADSTPTPLCYRPTDQTATLLWAATLYSTHHDLTAPEIDAELSSHFTSQSQSPTPTLVIPLYHPATIQTHQSLRNASARHNLEAEMRDFALDGSEREKRFGGLFRGNRKFLHLLAGEFGLGSTSEGAKGETWKDVVVRKGKSAPRVPAFTVQEAVDRFGVGGDWSAQGECDDAE